MSGLNFVLLKKTFNLDKNSTANTNSLQCLFFAYVYNFLFAKINIDSLLSFFRLPKNLRSALRI
jgi:hypothetical protein